MIRPLRRSFSLLFIALLPAPLLAQGGSALLKSDLVRFLTGTTYSQGEIAAIVRRSCLAFTPTARDRRDLRELGATPVVFQAIDGCMRARNGSAARSGTAARPAAARPLELVLLTRDTSAVAGAAAYVTVELRRGDTPVRSTRLVLSSAHPTPGITRDPVSAVTDATGRATFTVPAGTQAGTYPLVIATANGAAVQGTDTFVLTVLPAAPAAATLAPSTLAIEPGDRGTRAVVATITDAFGNPIRRHAVLLRPPAPRAGLSTQTRETSDSGTVRFELPASALHDADAFGLFVDGRALATLRVSVARAVAARSAAGGVSAARASGRMLDAARLTASGRIAAAEAVYDTVLAMDSTNLAARLGRAYVRSWQRKDHPARADFLSVLHADSLNVPALTGLAYNYAWAGEYADAESYFREALRIAPANPDADRGLAYVALWRGDPSEAVRRFDGVVRRHPRDAEALVGLGQAYLQVHEPSNARGAFARALAIDPARADARDGVRVARSSIRPTLEVSAWGGYSAFSSTPPSLPAPPGRRPSGDVGLRFAEVAYWPTPTVRVWAQYDNGLTLDDITFVHFGENAPAFYVGGFVNYGSRYTTRLETGIRDLPGQPRENLVRAEQVVDLPGAPVSLKVGGWLGMRPHAHPEWIANAAVDWRLSPSFHLEPTYFYARSGAPGANDQRVLLFGEYTFENGWKLGTGIAGGRSQLGAATGAVPAVSLTPGTSTQRLWDAFILTEAPFGAHRVHLLLRHQQVIHGAGLSVVALGLTLGLFGS
jgi:tetratricopeptide (TPR) repeat protein